MKLVAHQEVVVYFSYVMGSRDSLKVSEGYTYVKVNPTTSDADIVKAVENYHKKVYPWKREFRAWVSHRYSCDNPSFIEV